MQTVFRLLSLRYLLQRWDRSALIIISIALGVATLVSTRILNRCIETAAAETTTPLGIGDLYITNGELGVSRPIADTIREARIPGIASVQPLVVDRITLPGQDQRVAVLLGVELAKHQLPDDDNPLTVFEGHNAYKLEATRIKYSGFTELLAIKRRVVAISRPLYDVWLKNRQAESDPFMIRYGGTQIECIPFWVIDYPEDSPLTALGPNIVGMEIVQAARFLRPGPPVALAAVIGAVASEEVHEISHPPRVNRIDVLLEADASRDRVQNELASLIGDRATVRTPERQGQNTQEIIGGIQIGFTMCSIGAMVVGLFLVYNALAVTVSERKHDIGILRSIGATRFQIISLFAVAALILGALGATVGVPLGIGLAHVALDLISDDMASMFTNPNVNPRWPSAMTMILAYLAGITTAVFAALVPAVQAASQDPADAVRRVPGGVGGAWRVAHRAVCATLVAGGVAMILTRHDLPPRVGAFGGMVSALVGLLLAAPIFVGILVRFLQPVLRQMLSIEARLAADNLIRSPGRTGLVIGALAAGVAVMVQTAGVGRSNEEPVSRWLEEVIQADQFISAGTVTDAISSQAPVDPQVQTEVRKIAGVESVAGLRYIRPEYNNTLIFLTAIDMEAFVAPSQARGPNGLPELAKFLKLPNTNGVIMSENFAQRHNVDVGDIINIPSANGPVSLTILDTVVDYSWSRGTLFIDRAMYAKLFQDQQIDILHVFVTQESQAEWQAARGRVSQFAADRGYLTSDRGAIRKMLGELIDRIYQLVNLQQVVVGIVASLGVITSLLISVLQRKRELGLLLAVGATPRQIMMTVLAEAILMGALGTLLGFLIGIPLEWYVLRVVLFEESGFLFELLLPWGQVLGIAVGAILIATLAGVLPAMQAVKTRIPDAIAYE